MIIKYKIGSQQEVFSTSAISYLKKFPNHITNVYLSNIHWYNLYLWVLEQESPLNTFFEVENTHEFFNRDKDINTSTYIQSIF